MSRRVSFKLHGERLEAALKFSSDLNLPLNLVAERALYYTISQAYKKDGPADGLEHNTTTGDAERDPAASRQDANSSGAMANETAVDDPKV